MFDKLIAILKKQLHLADGFEITEASRIKEDLGADSLDVLSLLMTLEEDYGITVPDEKLMTFVTVGDVLAYLNASV